MGKSDFVAVAQQMETLAGQSKQAASEVRGVLLTLLPISSTLRQASEQRGAYV